MNSFVHGLLSLSELYTQSELLTSEYIEWWYNHVKALAAAAAVLLSFSDTSSAHKERQKEASSSRYLETLQLGVGGGGRGGGGVHCLDNSPKAIN